MHPINKPQINRSLQTVRLELVECSPISSRIGISATIDDQKIPSEVLDEAFARSRHTANDELFKEFAGALTKNPPDWRRAAQIHQLELKQRLENIGYSVEIAPPNPLVFGDRREFFKVLFSECEGVVELRALPSKKQLFTRNYREIARFCDKHRGENLYFGVATRDGGGGGKAHCLQLPGLWVDVDRKDGVSDAELSKLLRNAPIKPSVVLFSGDGYHLYFLFKEPEKATPEIERYLRGIARYFRGDTAAAEIARILRIPETLNHKYSPPRKVGIIEARDYRYSLEDFEIFAGPEERQSTEGNEPGWETPIIEDGVREGERNVSIARLAGKYIALGLSRHQILILLLDANSQFKPPLNRSEVERTLDSVFRTHERNHPQKSEEGETGAGNLPEVLKRLEKFEQTRTLHPAQDFKIGFLWYGIPVDKDIIFINSNRQIMSADRLPDGLVLDNRGFNLCRFSKEGITRFQGGSTVDGKSLALRLDTYFRRFLVIKDSRIFLLLAIWTMGTYVYRIFRVFPYLSLRSPTKECGKSRTEDLLSLVCFNAGNRDVSPSEAYLFRGPSKNGGTVLLDEVEGLRHNKDLFSALQGVLNSGFESGGAVTRIERRNGQFVDIEYPTYCPRVLAGINRLYETLEGRAITVFLERKLSEERVERFSRTRLFEEVQPMRDDLYIWALTHADDLQEVYSAADGFPALEGLGDRERDLWEPLVSIASICDAESGGDQTLTEQLCSLAHDLSRVRLEIDSANVIQILEVLTRFLGGKEEIRISPTDLLERFREDSYFEWLKSTKNLAGLLAPLGLVSSHQRNSETGERGRTYIVTREKLEDWRKRYRVGGDS